MRTKKDPKLPVKQKAPKAKGEKKRQSQWLTWPIFSIEIRMASARLSRYCYTRKNAGELHESVKTMRNIFANAMNAITFTQQLRTQVLLASNWYHVQASNSGAPSY